MKKVLILCAFGLACFSTIAQNKEAIQTVSEDLNKTEVAISNEQKNVSVEVIAIPLTDKDKSLETQKVAIIDQSLPSNKTNQKRESFTVTPVDPASVANDERVLKPIYIEGAAKEEQTAKKQHVVVNATAVKIEN